MPDSIVLVGSPTALGGHFGGMERTPAEARRLGLVDRLRAAPGLAGASVVDAGDAPNEPGWAPDDDRRAKNRSRIAVYLPRLAGHVRDGLLAHDGAGLFVIGGDCTSHAGAMAGIRRARPGIRLGICWFDAHGDFNTPATLRTSRAGRPTTTAGRRTAHGSPSTSRDWPATSVTRCSPMTAPGSS